MDEAQRAFEEATQLLEAGDLTAAGAGFERALDLEPRNGSFHWSLVFSRSGQIDDSRLAAMERLRTEIGTLPEMQRIDLHFALAHAYEARGRYDEAFRELECGNALKRAIVHYEEGATLRLFRALEVTFAHLLGSIELRDCGNLSARPVFIFGMPRSGTTLVEQLLSAHPEISAGGELREFEQMVEQYWLPLAERPAEISIEEVRVAVRTIGERYILATDRLAGDSSRTTDKQPHNFCYAPMIHLALPNARMIHVRRNKLDTCVSCYSTLFAEDAITYSYDLGELGRYYNAYDRLMSVWRKLLPTDRFLEVDYEALVSDFEIEAHRIAAFCGLPWDQSILNFHETKRPIRTASRVQVRRPLYRTSMGRAAMFAAHLNPLTDVLI